MNDRIPSAKDQHRSFLILAEIEKEQALSQRELANRLGIALGLVNSYLRNLVAKGFIRVKAFPRNRYAYLVTPKGLAEKSRLAYQHLSYFTSLYTATRQDYLELFRRLRRLGRQRVSFCGVDEVAEIALLSLRETGLELTGVFDEEGGREFFGHPVRPLSAIPASAGDVVISSLKRREQLREQLLAAGVDPATILAPGLPINQPPGARPER